MIINVLTKKLKIIFLAKYAHNTNKIYVVFTIAVKKVKRDYTTKKNIKYIFEFKRK